MSDLQSFVAQIQQANADATPLRIQGSNSKSFYGRQVADNSQVLDISGYQGIVSYEPTELVITARAGTPLSEIEAVLAEQGQMLGFEPPYFADNATLGGTVACGLSGPRRPYAGSVRDFVLGTKMLNGEGVQLSFGGQVMKNVAGYDVSRVLTGSLGTLGVIVETSLRVLPLAAMTLTLVQQTNEDDAIKRFNQWAGKPYPITAAAHAGEQLYLRLAGASSAVTTAASQIGGDEFTDGDQFWHALRELQLPFFQDNNSPLWRLSVPPATAPMNLGYTLLDWGGAQRWLISDGPAVNIFAAAAAAGGHAELFRGGDRTGAVFQQLDPVILKLQQRLKRSFDPQGIFNPGRMYQEI